MKKYFFIPILFIVTLYLQACSPLAPPLENDDAQQNEERANQLLAEDLRWMEEKNEAFDLLPHDVRIINEETKEPLGPILSYFATKEPFDTNRYKMYGSFHGEQYIFELGWLAPNVHALSYERVSGKKRESVSGSLLLHLDEYIDEVDFSVTDTLWQATLADVNGDGMLDFVVYVSTDAPDDAFYHYALSVFQFTGNDEEPFELAADMRWTNATTRLTNNPARLNDEYEWIAEHVQDEIVLGYFEEGDWYVPMAPYSNKSTAYYKDDDDHWVRSDETISFRNETRNEIIPRSSLTPNSPSSQTTDIEKTSKQTDEHHHSTERPLFTEEEQTLIEETDILQKAASSCREDENCAAGDEEDLKERAERAVIFYIERSIIARRDGQFRIAEPYIYPNSPVYHDMVKLAPSDGARGVSMTYVDYDKRGVDQIDETTFDVHLRNVFDIQGTKRTGHRTFESTMRVKYDKERDRFLVYELLEENELM